MSCHTVISLESFLGRQLNPMGVKLAVLNAMIVGAVQPGWLTITNDLNATMHRAATYFHVWTNGYPLI